MSRSSSIRDGLHANWWLGTLLLGVAFLWGCFDAPFFGLDDEFYLRGNRLLSEETPWHHLFLIHADQNFYYPVTLISWRLERPVWETILSPLAGSNAWPAGVRLGNLLIHLAAAATVWMILRQLRTPRALAAFVMAAFALHPYACEVVCWPIERKSALAAFLGFAALLLHMRARSVKGYALAALCYAAALLSKPSALGVFAVAAVWETLGRPVYEVAPRHARAVEEGIETSDPPKEIEISRPASRAAMLALMPWLLLSAAGIWVGYQAHKVNVLPPPGGNLWTAMLTDQVIITKYFLTLVWPGVVSAYYFVEPVVSLADARLWSCVVVIAAAVSISIKATSGGARRLTCFAWLWFLGALGPHLNLVALNDLMHDRFVYLSVPGFWFALGLGADGIVRRLTPGHRNLPAWCGAATVILVGMLWAVCSADRSRLFRDAKQVWTDAVEKEPDSAYAHLMLAKSLRNEAVLKRASGREREASNLLTRARDAYLEGMSAPDFDRYLFKVRAHVDLAYLFYKQEQLAASQRQALRALARFRIEKKHKTDASKAIQILGMIAEKRGDAKAALRQYDLALELQPTRNVLHFFRGRVLWKLFLKSEESGHKTAAEYYKALAIKAFRRVPSDSPKFNEVQRMLRSIQP